MLVGVADGKLVIVVAERILEAKRERVVTGRFGSVVRIETDAGRGVDSAGVRVAT